VCITGSAVGENGFTEAIARTLDTSVQRINLIDDTEARLSNLPGGKWNPDQLDNALAVALVESIGIKGINFRKGPFAIKKRWMEHKKSIVRTGILGGILVICLMANVMIDYHFKTSRLETLNNRITDIFRSTFPDVQRIVDPLQQMKANIEETRRSSFFPVGAENQVLMIDILNELSRGVPANMDVQFSRMVVAGDDSVVINGDTDTFNSVDAMKGRLEEAEIFKEVTIVSTTKDKDGKRIRFRLKIKI
jgi:type II secretory pathway component PulL